MAKTSEYGDMEDLKGTEITEITYDSDITSRDEPKKKSCCSGRCVLKFLRKNLLLLLLITSLAVGIGMGAGMRAVEPPLDEREQMYFNFPGEILMRMLKCMIIPLIVSSLISGVAGLSAQASGRIGLASVIYYLVTTVSAVMLGILLVCTIQPGFRSSGDDVSTDDDVEDANAVDSFLDLIRNMLPDNIVEACFRQTKTHQIPEEVVNTTACNITNTDPNACNYTYTHSVWSNGLFGRHAAVYPIIVENGFEIRKDEGMNVLGLVVYSLAMGVVVSMLGDVGKPLYHLSLAVAEATMILVSVVIWYSPIGISFLIAAEIVAMDDPLAELASLGWYMMTVITGLAIHGIITLPLIYLVVVRRNPFKFLVGTLKAMLTAFGTASSTSTLPVTYECLEVTNKVDRRVTRFVLPVGATINMDGTALYEAVAAIYIAQLNGMHLNAAEIIAISITATLASIGAASVPQAGLVTMVMVLSIVGLPADEVTKILAVDWLLISSVNWSAWTIDSCVSLSAGVSIRFVNEPTHNSDNGVIVRYKIQLHTGQCNSSEMESEASSLRRTWNATVGHAPAQCAVVCYGAAVTMETSDRFRTAVNVEGNCIGAGVVEHTCRKQLQEPLDEDTDATGTASDSDHLPAYTSLSSAESIVKKEPVVVTESQNF